MTDKYTYGWHDPRSVYGEPIKVIEANNKPNVPLWFKLSIKFIYWIKK